MILLDTHVVLWAVADERKLGTHARRVIGSTVTRYVSAVTHAELGIKAARNKIRLPAGLPGLLEQAGFAPLPFEARHARGFGRFPALDGHDPFDRMIVAQADVDGLTLLTADRTLLGLGQPWIIDARS